jgi:hypothetical protein
VDKIREKMKTTELRTGNYISTSYMSSSTLKVTAIHSDRVYFESVTHDFKSNTISSYIEPIPLTEEWLLKFGFEYNEHGNFLSKGGLNYNKGNRGSWHYCFTGIRQIEFVHTLQNVFFSLTGEELEVENG